MDTSASNHSNMQNIRSEDSKHKHAYMKGEEQIAINSVCKIVKRTTIQGCCNASSTVGRRFGSMLRHLRIKSLASSEIPLQTEEEKEGKLSALPSRCMRRRERRIFPPSLVPYATRPERITNKVIPIEYCTE